MAMAVNCNGSPQGGPGFLIHDVRQTSASEMSREALLCQFIDPPPCPDAVREYALVQPNGAAIAVHLPEKLRHLPTEILYNARGLELFEDITLLEDEYYLTACERAILRERAAEICAHIPDGVSVIELGCGSMCKTAILLDQLRTSKKRGIKFYAIDIEEQSLSASLSSLAENERAHAPDPEHCITYAGILGTYMQALAFFPQMECSSRVFLWLGSSIGNYRREDAAAMLKAFAEQALGPNDRFFIGIDKRNDATVVARAYNDTQGVTAEFALNGLDHVNELLQTTVLRRRDFEYFAGYNQTEGRHEAYYRARTDQVVDIPPAARPHGCNVGAVALSKGDLIRFEMSYKYSWREVEVLAEACGMQPLSNWTDPGCYYFFCLFQRRLSSNASPAPPLAAPMPVALGAAGIPTLADWREVWAHWDAITSPDLIADYSEQPIHLRHPIVFYLGHIPTFCDVLLSRCLGRARLDPQYYQRIFERGIDPVVEDPNQCHPHSEVPESWPAVEEILDYKQRVRQRVEALYRDGLDQQLEGTTRRRLGRVLHMALEHEIAHTETLLYMLVRGASIRPRPRSPHMCVATPSLCAPQWLSVAGGTAVIGLDDNEDLDLDQDDDLAGSDPPPAYGWDNECPQRQEAVAAFQIQHRPVSIGEYLRFLATSAPAPEDLMPASLQQVDGETELAVRTMAGPVPVSCALNWPAALNCHQAEAYLHHLRRETGDSTLRIPSEAELVHFYATFRTHLADSTPNVGFREWSPVPMSDHEPHILGSLWEWTSTVLEAHAGFQASALYPGYSSDFFDGLHQVVLGASWATHPRLAGRYRNFYQRSYPFAFIGVRFCRDLKTLKNS